VLDIGYANAELRYLQARDALKSLELTQRSELIIKEPNRFDA